jgi:ABC-type uncharacterized transport system permease subunit
MSRAIQALQVFLPIAYLAAAFLHAMHFGAPRAPRVVRARALVLAAALAMHLALFAATWRLHGVFPAFDAWSTLSCVALGVALLHCATSIGAREAGTGALLYGMAGGLQALASAFGSHAPAPPPGHPLSFELLHAFTSMAAVCALISSGLHGLLYLVVFRRMRRRSFDPLVRGLPSLSDLGTLTRRAALAGFLLSTVGLNFGIGWAHYAGVPGFHYTDPWVAATLVLWLHFGVIAFSRRIPGFSAQRASFAAAAGLSVLLVVGALTLLPDFTFHWRP